MRRGRALRAPTRSRVARRDLLICFDIHRTHLPTSQLANVNIVRADTSASFASQSRRMRSIRVLPTTSTSCVLRAAAKSSHARRRSARVAALRVCASCAGGCRRRRIGTLECRESSQRCGFNQSICQQRRHTSRISFTPGSSSASAWQLLASPLRSLLADCLQT